MAEMTAIADAPRVKEIVEKTVNPTRVEANTYGTREVVQLRINGEESEWHSVKGGAGPSRNYDKPLELVRYGIFYDPKTKTWLKVLPPESIGAQQFEKAEGRLRRSALQQRMALRVSGLPELAEQIKDVEVEIDGRKVYGFTSPHIGPSLGYVLSELTGSKRPKELTPDAITLFSDIYAIAADQAEKLYLDFGIWTADPNPGNILLRFTEEGIRVVLIDFANKIQDEENLFSGLSRERYKGNGYVDKLRSLLAGKIRGLHQNFIEFSNMLGVPFIRDPNAVKENIERSPAIVNARKTYPPAPLLPNHE